METDLDDSFAFENVADSDDGEQEENDEEISGSIPVFSSPLKGGGNRDVESIYQKKTQREHILIRPDTYIGSVESVSTQMWVYDAHSQRMLHKEIEYIPGLFKIFDEILVNASDNKQRDPKMNKLEVTIDTDTNTISVMNNGNGIPVTEHRKYKIFVPELIFGHLLTGSNYDDTMKKVTGGRNGYGAKLTNIFSKEFTVETADSSRGRVFKQVFRMNMTEKSAPKVSSYAKGKGDFTKVTFKPDLVKFNTPSISDDMLALFTRRVYDIAGCNPGVRVSFNGKRVPVSTFNEYVKLYLDEEKISKLVFDSCDRWNIAFAVSDGQFSQVSFVNSIATTHGGTHVTHVADIIASRLRDTLNKKHKNMNIKPFQIKNHMWIFVRSLVENPAFDSQTKELMTLQPSKFGSKCVISAEFMKKMEKSGIIDNIVSWAKFKENRDLAKKDGRKVQRITGIPKLDDANDAGKKAADKCTLILTEGDSAKTLAVAGISVVGRDKYGVFPLRGKLLNVRDADAKKVAANEEITNLKKILGLRTATKYDDVKSLRYGHVMIMTDQDQDGSHIKGLLINFFHTFWPDLLKIPGFLNEFVTPIVKVTKEKTTHSFFTLPDYRRWKEENNLDAAMRGWTVKYYKGLGTSTTLEAKEYFSNLKKHKIDFQYVDKEDDTAIDLAFNKKKADERKEWLRKLDSTVSLNHNVAKVRYTEFVDKELILFSESDNVRSIPSVVDGLKPGQRKILFSCFKRNLKNEIKVAQLSGYVGEHSAYHHGETSLATTIVGMAQDFVGSNNINYLLPMGQFGTRLQGGKDAASPRYIHTKLASITRKMFNIGDDPLLKYLDDDGMGIEPEWYVPILPSILVNGTDGIGTGWSTSIPAYDPHDIIANLLKKISGETMNQMVPWYKGFTGTIVPSLDKKKLGTFVVTGKWKRIDDITVQITELPVGTWTQSYKEFLESCLPGADSSNTKSSSGGGGGTKKAGAGGNDSSSIKKAKDSVSIAEYRENHTTESVLFTISFPSGNVLDALIEEGFEKKMRLVSSVSTSNMNAYDPQGRIKLYSSPLDIIDEFYDVRSKFYSKRKLYLLSKLEKECNKLSNQARFILEVIDGTIPIAKKSTTDLVKLLASRGYDSIDPKASNVEGSGTEEDVEIPTKGESKLHFEYLISMPMGSMSTDKVADLKKQVSSKKAEIEVIVSTSESDMWKRDLKDLLTLVESEIPLTEKPIYEFPSAEDVAEMKSKSTTKKALKAAPAPQKKKAVKTKAKETAKEKAPSGSKTKPKKRKIEYDSEEESESESDDAFLSDSDDDDDDDLVPVVKEKLNIDRQSSRAKVKPRLKKVVVDDDESDDDDDDLVPDMKEKEKSSSASKRKPAPKPKATTKATTKPKPKAQPPPPTAKPRSTRVMGKKVVYSVENEEESDGGNDSDSFGGDEFSSDESDF